MTTRDKVFSIVSAILMIVLGVLIAINGIGAVIDLYFGIVILISGVALLVLDIIDLIQNHQLSFGLTTISCVLISIAIALLANWLSFAVVIGIVLFALIGLGVALAVYGAYLITKHALANGIFLIVMGSIAIIFSILYMTIPEFQQAFWIIVGIALALYGVFALVMSFINLGKKSA